MYLFLFDTEVFQPHSSLKAHSMQNYILSHSCSKELRVAFILPSLLDPMVVRNSMVSNFPLKDDSLYGHLNGRQ